MTLVEGFTAEQVEDQLEAAVNELLTGQEFGEEVSIPFSRFLACLLRYCRWIPAAAEQQPGERQGAGTHPFSVLPVPPTDPGSR